MFAVVCAWFHTLFFCLVVVVTCFWVHNFFVGIERVAGFLVQFVRGFAGWLHKLSQAVRCGWLFLELYVGWRRVPLLKPVVWWF